MLTKFKSKFGSESNLKSHPNLELEEEPEELEFEGTLLKNSNEKDHNPNELLFEDIVSLYPNIKPIVEANNPKFNEQLKMETVRSTIEHMNREFGLEVEIPDKVVVDDEEVHTSAYRSYPDKLLFNSYSDAAYPPNSFHELIHKYQVRRYLGGFESNDEHISTLEEFERFTTPEIRNKLLNSLQLENNDKFKRYLMLLSFGKSEEIPRLLKNEPENIEELNKEFYNTIEEYGLDGKCVESLMEVFASFSSMYFRGVLEDRSERDTYLRLTSKNYGFGGEFKSYIKELFENYDSYKGSKKEKFRKVMEDQDEFFERI